MRRLLLVAIVLVVAGNACRSRTPLRPELTVVTGTVSKAGQPSPHALVVIGGDAYGAGAHTRFAHPDSTFTDTLGVYAFTIPSGTDSVVVSARDGFDGRVYAETCSGHTEIIPDRSRVGADVALTLCFPI